MPLFFNTIIKSCIFGNSHATDDVITVDVTWKIFYCECYFLFFNKNIILPVMFNSKSTVESKHHVPFGFKLRRNSKEKCYLHKHPPNLPQYHGQIVVPDTEDRQSAQTLIDKYQQDMASTALLRCLNTFLERTALYKMKSILRMYEQENRHVMILDTYSLSAKQQITCVFRSI